MGFAVLNKFDLADRLLASIDYPIKDLVIINNSGNKLWSPTKPEIVERLWHIEVPYGIGLQAAQNLIIKSTPYASKWLLVNDDCQFLPGTLEKLNSDATVDSITFAKIYPVWSAFFIGEQVVDQVGLFDESFYPIYFCDNDYERRAKNLNIKFNNSDAEIAHSSGSTSRDFPEANYKTFKNNEALLNQKIAEEDFSNHGWRLSIRRNNRWD